MTDFPVVNVHVDELSSARIWQHKLYAILSANININYRLPIKVYYRICTLRHIRIEIIHGNRQPMLKLKTHSGFHDLFLKYTIYVHCQKTLKLIETGRKTTSSRQFCSECKLYMFVYCIYPAISKSPKQNCQIV